MGQFCTKPGFLALPSSAARAEDLLREAAGPGFDLLSPRLAEGFRGAVSAVLERPGVAVLGGAGPSEHGTEPILLTVTAADALAQPDLLQTEMFGPASVVIRDADARHLEQLAESLSGQLTSSIWAEPGDDIDGLVRILERKAGRILFGDWPTGVTVSYAQQHGGPYPASTAPATTSVGTAAVRRFLRPVAYQGFPDAALPRELREANPLGLRRRVDGEWV